MSTVTVLQVHRSLPRYLTARIAGPRLPGLLTGAASPLRLVRRDPPELPTGDWAVLAPRLAGICGSDLAALTGASSLYFSAVASFPFVPGHEVVADLVSDCADLAAGTRVVLDPVLGCATRGLTSCPGCAAGQPNLCDGITSGHLSPGLQTGFCADTGGGWGQRLVAHRSQLHPVDPGLPDERAVLAEPLACALHVATRALETRPRTVAVIGAGSVGLFTVLALRHLAALDADVAPPQVVVTARHPRQAARAREFGADTVLVGDDPVLAMRRVTRAVAVFPERSPAALLGGADVAIEAAGSRSGLQTALRLVRAGGRVVLAGMPAPGADLSPAWLRELEVVGAYSAAGYLPSALQLAGSAPLGDLVTRPFALPAWREALDLALGAGAAGVVKVAFDPRLSA